MKRHLNTLYIVTPETYLCKEGESVLVRRNRERVAQLPLISLGSIVCFGAVSMSTGLMAACAAKKIAVSFLSVYGRFQFRITGQQSGNVLLRREQYRMGDDSKRRCDVAKYFVMGKLINARSVLKRALRNHELAGAESVERSEAQLLDAYRNAEHAADVDTLRGIEGEAAKSYFGAYDSLITAQKEHFKFDSRVKRPPTDPVNALLSFIYTLLMHDVRSALEVVGLDPQVGYLHCDRPGRPALALDMMEEFRSIIADRLVLSLINLKQVRPDGFEQEPSGAVTMSETTLKTVLAEYQKRKQEEVMHPVLEERTTLGLVPHIQAMLFARFIRGDMPIYPAYVVK